MGVMSSKRLEAYITTKLNCWDDTPSTGHTTEVSTYALSVSSPHLTSFVFSSSLSFSLYPPFHLSSILLLFLPLLPHPPLHPPLLSTLFSSPLSTLTFLQVCSAKICPGTETASMSWGACYSLPLSRCLPDIGSSAGNSTISLQHSRWITNFITRTCCWTSYWYLFYSLFIF